MIARMSSRRIIMISLLVIVLAVWGCMSCIGTAEAKVAKPTVLYIHVYSPIAAESGVRSGNYCMDPQHPDDPRCLLTSFAFRSAEEAVSKTDAAIKDVRITTDERDVHLKNGTLEKLVIERAGVTFTDHDSRQKVSTFKVVSVSDLDVLSYLTPDKGRVAVTVKFGLNGSGADLATAFIETNVYVSKSREENKKDDDSADDGRGGIDDSGDDEGYDDEGDIEDDETIDDESAAEKKKEEEKKAKAKAEKEMMDKATAKISAKERDKEENIAVTAGDGKSGSDGPSPLGIGLIALAAALAGVYGRLIRSDVRVMKWYKQKKALRGK